MLQQVVAGKPRLAGALAALEYFGVPGAGRRAERYAAVKQEHLVVRTLDEVSRPALAEGRLARKTEG